MISVQGRGSGAQSTDARAQSVEVFQIIYDNSFSFCAATECPCWEFFTRNLVLQTFNLSSPPLSTTIQTRYSSDPSRDGSDSSGSSDWMCG